MERRKFIKTMIKSQKQPQEKQILVKKLIVLALMLFSVLCVLFLPWDTSKAVRMVNTDTLSYVRARVVSVDAENLTADSLETDRQVGTQDITVEICEGAQTGETISLTNYVTRNVNVVCREGTRIVICIDQPQNAEAYYTVFNYDRAPQVALILVLFCMIVLLVGQKKGGWSLLGLFYIIFMIFMFLVRAIYYGWNSSLCTFGTVGITAAAALFLMGGPSRKMVASLCSTFLGVMLSGGMYLLCGKLLHLSGYNLDEIDTLLVIRQGTGMSIKGLIFCAVLIAALGAVMDVAVSICSALDEIHTLRPERTARELFGSGMNIGQDMIGTMTNTLILAYAGAELVTMLVLMGYGYGFNQLLHSDYLALQLSQGISATIGVVLTVPVASAIAAGMLTKAKKHASAQ